MAGNRAGLVPKKIAVRGGGQRTYWVRPEGDRAAQLRNYAQQTGASNDRTLYGRVPRFEVPKGEEVAAVMQRLSPRARAHIEAYYSERRWKDEGHSGVARRAFLGAQAAIDRDGKLLPALTKEQLDRSDRADIPPRQLAADAAKMAIGEWTEYPAGHPFAPPPPKRTPASYADKYDKDPNLAEEENAMAEMYGRNWRSRR